MKTSRLYDRANENDLTKHCACAAKRRKFNDFWSRPNPQTPDLQLGTLLLRIREQAGKRASKRINKQLGKRKQQQPTTIRTAAATTTRLGDPFEQLPCSTLDVWAVFLNTRTTFYPSISIFLYLPTHLSIYLCPTLRMYLGSPRNLNLTL